MVSEDRSKKWSDVGRLQTAASVLDEAAQDGDTTKTSDDTSDEFHDARSRPSGPPSGVSSESALSKSRLLDLPPELIDHICLFLSVVDLDSLALTCAQLKAHATSDLCWHRHVQENLPGMMVKSPSPCTSYHDLYYAHDPHWFLPKYKIWFNDYFLTGKVIIARFDPRRGCIEAYTLVAERATSPSERWEVDDQVLIQEFRLRVKLHMDQPVIHLDARSSKETDIVVSRHRDGKFDYETMMMNQERSTTYTNFLLTRKVEVRPGMQAWPPYTVPAQQRVRNVSLEKFSGMGHRPQTRSDICDQAFRLRRWMNLLPITMLPGAEGLVHHYGEEVQTFATLDPALYTPTADKPFRGIWVGDFSGHGCEFILMHQPDSEPFDEDSIAQRENETLDEFLTRKREERIYRGRIEAVKLTGDPNVPRGEYTFVADDIGNDGFIRVAEEEQFRGARIVKSRGQTAERGFQNNQFIEAQLIIISPDKLAHFWAPFSHISFFHRVRIDDFLDPGNAIHRNTGSR